MKEQQEKGGEAAADPRVEQLENLTGIDSVGQTVRCGGVEWSGGAGGAKKVKRGRERKISLCGEMIRLLRRFGLVRLK